MIDKPLIRVDFEGLRAGVIAALDHHNNDFNVLIKESLENTLNEDWVKQQVQKEVNNIVKEAISNLSKTRELQSIIENQLTRVVTNSLIIEYQP